MLKYGAGHFVQVKLQFECRCKTQSHTNDHTVLEKNQEK